MSDRPVIVSLGSHHRRKSDGEIVLAIQWFPFGDDRHMPNIKGIIVHPNHHSFKPTLGEAVRIEPGDWIITRGDGLRVTCTHGAFVTQYEAVIG